MIRKGLWSPDEDEKLRRSISKYVNGSWNDIARKAGLQRCGRSCRQRWLNHLRPGLRKERFSKDEVKQVMELQSKLGNRWSEIAAQLRGRTDNEVKNLWNTVIKRRRLYMGIKTDQKMSPAEVHAAEEDLIDPLSEYSHADSPSYTASSQSASSSHSSWSLHVSPSPADCSTLASHADENVSFMDELYLQQLLMINGPDLSQGDQPRIMNGQDCLQVDQHATSSGSLGVMQSSYGALAKEDFVKECCSQFSCLMPTSFESTLPNAPAHDRTPIIPPLSTSPDPDWDSAVKLVDVDATLSYPPPNYIIESGSHVFSFTPIIKTSQNSSILESSTLPSKTIKTSQNNSILESSTVQTPPSIGNGHCLRSLLHPQQCMSMNHEGSQALALSPHLINILNHEDRSYILNLDTNNDAYDDLSQTSSFLQTSFNHRNEFGTQDIIGSLLWNGGCQ